MGNELARDCFERARRLLETALPSVSAESMGRWHGISNEAPDSAQVLREASRHALAMQEAHAISGLLAARNIAHVVLKGPLLQEMLYGEETQRPYADLDFMVSPTQWREARDAIHLHGWRSRTPSWMRSLHFHEAWTNPRNAPLDLELHRAWVDRANFFRLPKDVSVARWISYRVPGGQLPGLAPSDLLLYLCLHAAKHGFLNETALAENRPNAWFLHPNSGNRMIWWMDVHLLLVLFANRLDWQGMTADTRAWNIAAPVAATLTLAGRFFPGGHAEDAMSRLGLSGWSPQRGSSAMRRMAERTERRHGAAFQRRAGFRALRMGQLTDLFFPPTPVLRSYYGNGSVRWRRLTHPGHMLCRLMGH